MSSKSILFNLSKCSIIYFQLEGFKWPLLYRTMYVNPSPHSLHKAVVGTNLPQFPFVVCMDFCITYSTAGMLLIRLLRSLKFPYQSKLCPLEVISTAKSQQNWKCLEYLTIFSPLLEKHKTNICLREQEFITESQECSPEHKSHYSFSLLSGIPLFLGWEEALGASSGHGAAAEHWIWLSLWSTDMWGFLGTNQAKACVRIRMCGRRVKHCFSAAGQTWHPAPAGSYVGWLSDYKRKQTPTYWEE